VVEIRLTLPAAPKGHFVDKIDLRKELAGLYKASSREPTIIQVPTMEYLMIDGQGDPETSADFQAAMESLFGLAYTLKFGLKKRGGQDFSVLGPEGLWWVDGMDPAVAFSRKDLRKKWQWTLMILMPDFIRKADVEAAREELRARRNPKALDLVRFEKYKEGRCVTMMHLGPYDTERATIERMHAYARDAGYSPAGKHHEIYLNDPRRTAPERLKTILRHPIAKHRG
jgi:hypothetical protein